MASSASRGVMASGRSASSAAASGDGLGVCGAAGARGAEQRQIVGKLRRLRPAVGPFQLGQHFAGPRQHRLRQACELGDVDAVGAIGGARDDAIEEDDLVAPFLDLDGGVGGVREAVGERGQLMIVGGEQARGRG